VITYLSLLKLMKSTSVSVPFIELASVTIEVTAPAIDSLSHLVRFYRRRTRKPDGSRAHVRTHGCVWSNIRMEIENPKTAGFVPLLGAFNFLYTPLGAQRLPDNFSFGIDWTKEGDEQEILCEHIRSSSPILLKQRGQQYQGVFKHEWGFHTNDGIAIVEVA
jgi:hypothetical protein